MRGERLRGIVIRGNTLDEIITLTEQSLDEHLEHALDEWELHLRDFGATDEELEAGLRQQHAAKLRRKRANLARVRQALVE